MTKKNMYKKSDRTFVNPYNFVSIDRKKNKTRKYRRNIQK